MATSNAYLAEFKIASVDPIATRVTATETRLTTDETNITNLQNTAAIKVLSAAITHTLASAAPQAIGTLPAGCVVVGAMINVTTAFNGTSPLLDLGVTGTIGALVANTDVTEGTPGAYIKWPAASNLVGAAGGTPIIGTFSYSGTPSTGAATCKVFYI